MIGPIDFKCFTVSVVFSEKWKNEREKITYRWKQQPGERLQHDNKQYIGAPRLQRRGEGAGWEGRVGESADGNVLSHFLFFHLIFNLMLISQSQNNQIFPPVAFPSQAFVNGDTFTRILFIYVLRVCI